MFDAVATRDLLTTSVPLSMDSKCAQTSNATLWSAMPIFYAFTGYVQLKLLCFYYSPVVQMSPDNSGISFASHK